ncbi:MAG: hypothetical protein WA948_11095 [Pontixanthobacter sp.]
MAAMFVTGLCLTAPANAELPDPVRAMIDAAIAGGEPEQVATIIAFARQTNPDETAALDQIESDYAALQDRRQAERAAARKEEIRTAGLLEN